MSDPAAMTDEAARHQALQRLRRRRNLNNQFRLYVVVNVVLVLVAGQRSGLFLADLSDRVLGAVAADPGLDGSPPRPWFQ